MEKLDTTKTSWDLSLLLKGDNDPSIPTQRKKIEAACTAFVKKWKNNDDYLKDPKKALEALDENEKLDRLYGCDGNEGYYFYLRKSLDQNDPNIKAKYNNIHDFAIKLANTLQFFTLRLARIPKKTQTVFLKDPGLQKYHHFLERLFANAKYLLTEDEEKIMSLKAKTAHTQWVEMTSGFIAKEERDVLHEDGTTKKESFSTIASLVSSQQKEVRDKAATAFNEITTKHSDVAEVEINAILADKKVNDELRKILRPDSARHIADDIDSDVVDAMLSTVVAHFDIAKKFYQLKAKLMNVPKLKYHERNVPYGNVDKKYSYDDSVQLIHKVFKNLDDEFADIFKTFVTKGHVDVFPKKGKQSGAYCMHYLLTQPTYILLNHTDKLLDVTTLAHESGHGINNELMRKKQHALYFDTPLSTAEVASTFMEDFVLQEIMKEADDELRLSLMMAKLNDDISSIHRQVACYKFEQELHKTVREKGYLAKEAIGKMFQKHMGAYMGPAVEQSKGSENWWVYWSHIRRFFYVYSYASGLLISKALQNGVRKDPKFIKKVKEFLSAGLSQSPKDIFKQLGIDISDKKFWESGLQETEQLLRDTEALAKQLGKI